MTPTIEELKQALSTIWALVYRSSQVPHLDHEQTEKLQKSLDVIAAGRDGDDYFNRWSSYVQDCVRVSGLLSIHSRKPEGTEEIMGDCARLKKHLDLAIPHNRTG